MGMTPVGVACCLVDPRRGSPKPTKQRVSGGVSRAPSPAWVGGLTGGEGAEGPGALVHRVGLPHLPGPPGSSFWAGTVSVLWLWGCLWPGGHGCLKRCVEDSEATGKMSALHWRCPPPAAGVPTLCVPASAPVLAGDPLIPAGAGSTRTRGGQGHRLAGGTRKAPAPVAPGALLVMPAALICRISTPSLGSFAILA